MIQLGAIEKREIGSNESSISSRRLISLTMTIRLPACLLGLAASQISAEVNLPAVISDGN